jgi:CMP-N-acetylneuraminic acid synthetase
MIAVIPARTGSKRIENKNFLDFYGKPVINYTIHALRESRLFTDIVIATDGDYTDGHCTIYKREPVDDEQNLTEFLTDYIKKTGYDERFICLAYACSPFIYPGYLMAAHQEISWYGWDTVFPVAPGPGKINFTLETGRDSHAVQVDGKAKKSDKTYHTAGMFWFLRVDRFMESGKFFTDNSGCIIIPKVHGIDIDTPDELEHVRAEYGKIR